MNFTTVFGLTLLVVLTTMQQLAVGTTEPLKAHRIVTLGDSITDGYTYQLLIMQALKEAGKPVPVIINAGAGGNTTAQMLARLDDDVLHFDPDLVILNCGMNDRMNRSPQDFRADVAGILDRLAAAKVPVVMSTVSVLAPKFSDVQRTKLDPLNEILKQLAKERGLPIALIREQMTPDNTTGELQEPDGVHLRLPGYRLFTRAVLDAMGYADVAVPKEQKIDPLPGIIHDWHFTLAADGKPLAVDAAKALTPDSSWKSYSLPDKDPVEHWWQQSMQQWGVGMRLHETVGGAENAGYVGIANIPSESEREVWVNVGAEVRSVWLNGEKLPARPEMPYHGWHPGRDRLKAHLHKGDNTLIIETGKWFFVSVTDDYQW